MINLDPNVNSALPRNIHDFTGAPKIGGPAASKSAFSETVKAVQKYVSEVDDLQRSSEASVVDLLAGKEDITTVVSAVAKADISFKLLVGVRDKLIEAYKQTMNMPL